MTFEIEIPDKYARKLESVKEVDPTVEERIEVGSSPNSCDSSTTPTARSSSETGTHW